MSHNENLIFCRSHPKIPDFVMGFPQLTNGSSSDSFAPFGAGPSAAGSTAMALAVAIHRGLGVCPKIVDFTV